MLLLGGTAVAPGAPLQPDDQIVVQVAHMQISKHMAFHEDNDNIDLILGAFCRGSQPPRTGLLSRDLVRLAGLSAFPSIGQIRFMQQSPFIHARTHRPWSKGFDTIQPNDQAVAVDGTNSTRGSFRPSAFATGAGETHCRCQSNPPASDPADTSVDHEGHTDDAGPGRDMAGIARPVRLRMRRVEPAVDVIEWARHRPAPRRRLGRLASDHVASPCSA